ncbi:hypothetical protein [Nocardia huaxiensis]|uniref:Uncharacterized protein n=1 Tax=Nocardia huaxiensis TaxID=2755382 RepID=A0A7D6V628_9NOCA|nr:hypothetical protein [Nocardia huaxiensis]QLY28372.1 hypothetical protein H0264_23695 [Nocardia huaxiensis]UFS98177.1 hypothetical protein LPY97_09910 [Nocardia huaxiensis]
MTDLVTRAQLVLLARTLHVPFERVAHLEKLGAQRLHELQQSISGKLFDQHAPVFERISSLVPIIPLGISLPIVQRVVPPTMTGRAAGAVGVLHRKKAVDALTRLTVAYAADCAPYLDPRTVGQLADDAPPAPVIEIVNELLRRRDYITAGPFLAYATPELIRAVEDGVPDDEGLIRSAAYAYSGEHISAIVRQLVDGDSDRIPRLLRTVIDGSKELRLAALSVFARCTPDVISDVGAILFATAPPSAIADLITTYLGAGATADLLRFLGRLSPPSLTRLALNPVTGDIAEDLVAAVDGSSDIALWRGVLEPLARTPEGVRRRAGARLAQLDTSTVIMLPAIAQAARLWGPLLWILAATDVDIQARFGEVWAAHTRLDPDVLERRIADQRLDSLLATLTATLRILR